MKLKSVLYLLCAVIFYTATQILAKINFNRWPFQISSDYILSKKMINFFMLSSVVSQLIGLFFFWLALSILDLGKLIPVFMGLYFVAIIVFSTLIFDEQLYVTHYVGIFLIIFGSFLIVK